MSASLPEDSLSPDNENKEALPNIADHVLIRPIGKGAYGEVWLARNVMGGWHAAKVIYRRTFSDDRPFQREFEGICRFEPISRSHPGLITVLHVGKNEAAGYFYYVMELADDARTGQKIEPDSYTPRTLSQEMALPERMPLEKSLPIGLSLACALGYLHEQSLIHRDIKPSNIIFVKGVPKFADIGLITEAGKDVSSVGSLNYMPPEGPGEPTGDIFSLGKVFYGLFMGMPCKCFPEPPGAAEEFATVPALLQLNSLILKACHHDPRQRFQTANELHQALLAVTETVPGKPPGTGAVGAPVPGVTARKATGAPEGRPVASGEQRPKARLSRRAALLIGVPTAVGVAYFSGKWGTREDPVKWQVLYDLLDDKLACFMGYVGRVSPSTKFLIYSRGTDKNWITPGFQAQWVTQIEARFPELKGRISTMEIKIPPGRARATFQNPETAEEMKETIKSILRLDRDPTPTPPPVLVLMDTAAARGVYDDENKGTGITNAEELQKQLRNLPLDGMHTVSISIDSSKRDWQGEQRVLAYKPSLVIFHRSAFFHPVNAELGFGYPPF